MPGCLFTVNSNLILLFSFLLFRFSYAQDFKQHILFLASDSMHGRAPATIDEINASNYFFSQFSASGCDTIIFQKFPFKNDSAINVIGIIENGKDSTIIFSAHYDGLGFGNGKSKDILKKGIHNGADDNASGVALLLELQKEIAKWSNENTLRYNYVFAAFSAHEAGLFGSDFFSKSKICESLKIKTVINFDMVGRLDEASKTIRVSGLETESFYQPFFESTENFSLNFRYDDSNLLVSDLKPFVKKNIPALNITTGVHSDYHRMSDDENKINYKGMNLIFNLLNSLIKFIEKS